MKSLLQFLREEDGPTAVEYAVLLSLIIVVCLSAIKLVGDKNASMWDGNETSIGAALTP
ncbi:MAG: Flp family type IVb pilin [Planctomycetia bacterium]